MKPKFKYYRDKENRPIITVCEIEQDDRIARGVAICSSLDNPCKATGRKIALDRAQYGLQHDSFGLMIKRIAAFKQLANAEYFCFAKSESWDLIPR